MNPLSHLCGKQFKELTPTEILDVMREYAESNRYPFPDIEITRWTTRVDVLKYFEDNYYRRSVLIDFFEYWCN